MKKLVASGMLALSITLAAMDKTELSVDQVTLQAQELKAKQSQLAGFHEKNSFLDAYMNPTNFTELSVKHICFTHYKYPQVNYVLTWDKALEHLAQASNETAAVNKAKEKNEDWPILKLLSQDPLMKLTEAQKYDLQILCFASYLDNQDLDIKAAPTVDKGHMIRNRHLYRFAFAQKNPKDVLERSKSKLHYNGFNNLTVRIKAMRYVAITHTVGETLEGRIYKTGHASSCLIS